MQLGRSPAPQKSELWEKSFFYFLQGEPPSFSYRGLNQCDPQWHRWRISIQLTTIHPSIQRSSADTCSCRLALKRSMNMGTGFLMHGMPPEPRFTLGKWVAMVRLPIIWNEFTCNAGLRNLTRNWELGQSFGNCNKSVESYINAERNLSTPWLILSWTWWSPTFLKETTTRQNLFGSNSQILHKCTQNLPPSGWLILS